MVAIGLFVLGIGTWSMMLPHLDPDVSQAVMMTSFPIALFLIVDGILLLLRAVRLSNPRPRDKP